MDQQKLHLSTDSKKNSWGQLWVTVTWITYVENLKVKEDDSVYDINEVMRALCSLAESRKKWLNEHCFLGFLCLVVGSSCSGLCIFS